MTKMGPLMFLTPTDVSNGPIEASPQQAAGNLHPRKEFCPFLDSLANPAAPQSGISPSLQPAKHCRQAEPAGNGLAIVFQILIKKRLDK